VCAREEAGDSRRRSIADPTAVRFLVTWRGDRPGNRPTNRVIEIEIRSNLVVESAHSRFSLQLGMMLAFFISLCQDFIIVIVLVVGNMTFDNKTHAVTSSNSIIDLQAQSLGDAHRDRVACMYS